MSFWLFACLPVLQSVKVGVECFKGVSVFEWPTKVNRELSSVRFTEHCAGLNNLRPSYFSTEISAANSLSTHLHIHSDLYISSHTFSECGKLKRHYKAGLKDSQSVWGETERRRMCSIPISFSFMWLFQLIMRMVQCMCVQLSHY